MKNNKFTNKRAYFDYQIIDKFMAGVVLSGAEVASIRAGRLSMQATFVTLKNSEAWINNLELSATNTNQADLKPEQKSRQRKLLLKSSQLKQLQAAKDSGLSIVPLKLINGRYIKLEIATAKGKKKHDKRASIKDRQQKVEAQRALKHL